MNLSWILFNLVLLFIYLFILYTNYSLITFTSWWHRGFSYSMLLICIGYCFVEILAYNGYSQAIGKNSWNNLISVHHPLLAFCWFKNQKEEALSIAPLYLISILVPVFLEMLTIKVFQANHLTIMGSENTEFKSFWAKLWGLQNLKLEV